MREFLFYGLLGILWSLAFIRIFFIVRMVHTQRYDLLDRNECVDVICDVLRGQNNRRGLIVATPSRNTETQFLSLGDEQTLYWDIPHQHSIIDKGIVDDIIESFGLSIHHDTDDEIPLLLIPIPKGNKGKEIVNTVLNNIFSTPSGYNVTWI